MLQEKLLSLEKKLRKLEDPPAQSLTDPQAYQDFPSYDTHNQDATAVNLPISIFDSVAPSSLLAAYEPFETAPGSPGTFSESIFDFLQPIAPSRSSTPTRVAPSSEYRNGFELSNSSHQGTYDSPYNSPQLGGVECLSLFCKREL
jgi:hypothetical protein